MGQVCLSGHLFQHVAADRLGKGNDKGGALFLLAYDIDMPFVLLDDFFADRKPYSRAFKLILRVQSLEWNENVLFVSHVKAYSIILDKDIVNSARSFALDGRFGLL